MRDTSRRNPDLVAGPNKNINPELLASIYEAIAAAQLVLSGKFDEKIIEFKQAKLEMEEKLGLVKTLEDAQAEAEKTTKETKNVLAEANSVLDQAKAKLSAADARHAAANSREGTLTDGETALSTGWSALRKDTDKLRADRVEYEDVVRLREQDLTKRETAVRVRENAMTEAEKKMKQKLAVLAS